MRPTFACSQRDDKGARTAYDYSSTTTRRSEEAEERITRQIKAALYGRKQCVLVVEFIIFLPAQAIQGAWPACASQAPVTTHARTETTPMRPCQSQTLLVFSFHIGFFSRNKLIVQMHVLFFQ
jgi:hypothetical protein